MVGHELLVIGAMLSSSSAVDVAGRLLNQSDFLRRELGHIFSIIVAMRAAGKPVTDFNLVRAHVDKLIGEGVNQVTESALRDASIESDPAVIEHYCELVKEDSRKRDLFEIASKITLRLNSNDRSEDIIAHIDVMLQETRGKLLSYRQEDVHLAVSEAAEWLRQPAESRILKRIYTGFATLDSAMHGFQVPALVLFGGETGGGKTAAALHFALRAAADGNSVYIFSMEMRSSEIAQRMISNQCAVDANVFSNPDGFGSSIRTEFANRADFFAEKLRSQRIRINDTSNWSLDALCRQSTYQKAVYGLDFLVVDYLDLVDGGHKTNKEKRHEYNAIVKKLKSLSTELECCILLLAQVSEQAKHEQYLDHRAWAESKSIGFHANQALVMYSLDNNDDGTGKRLLWVIKNRGGVGGYGVHLQWNGAYQQFCEIDGYAQKPSAKKGS